MVVTAWKAEWKCALEALCQMINSTMEVFVTTTWMTRLQLLCVKNLILHTVQVKVCVTD